MQCQLHGFVVKATFTVVGINQCPFTAQHFAPFTAVGCLLVKKKKSGAGRGGTGGGEISVLKAERKRRFTCVSMNTCQ